MSTVTLPIELINKICEFREPTPTSKIIKKYFKISMLMKKNLKLSLKNDLKYSNCASEYFYCIEDYYYSKDDFKKRRNSKIWFIIIFVIILSIDSITFSSGKGIVI